MKIRTKTILAFVVMTIILIGIGHEVSSTILLSSFAALEQKEDSQTVNSVRGDLSSRFSDLSTRLSDWSSWDDAYKFVQDNNSAFINDNINPSAFTALGANFMLFVNSSGKYVNGWAVDLTNYSMGHIPQSFLSLVASNPQIWNFNSTYPSVTGIVVLPQGPMVLASRPILTSVSQGPSEGALILARYLDHSYVGALAATESLPITLTSYQGWQGSTDPQAYTSVLPSIFVRPLNSSTTGGYIVLNDIFNKPAVVLDVSMPRDTYNAGVVTTNFIEFSIILISVLFSFVMYQLMERMVLLRLSRLDNDVKKIGIQTGSSPKLSVSGNDDISSLSRSINKMLEEIETKTALLRKSERFSAIGELSTMVAHDLRNPLQGIANAAFFLKRNPLAGPKEKEMLGLIEEDVKYSNKIVNDLLDYSREMRLDLSEIAPDVLVQQSLSMVSIPPTVALHLAAQDEPILRVDVDKVKRAFINIINNAIDAMPNGGSLSIDTTVSDHFVSFLFTDTGVGMTKEVAQRIFTPLYTTKAKGMGFGLSICKRIIEGHGGSITVKSTQGKGTTFTISLPTRGVVRP